MTTSCQWTYLARWRGQVIVVLLIMFCFVLVFLGENLTTLTSNQVITSKTKDDGVSLPTRNVVDYDKELDAHPSLSPTEFPTTKYLRMFHSSRNQKSFWRHIRHCLRRNSRRMCSLEQEPPKVVWSHARSDRSGAVIQDMLMCHAYAFQHNMVYAGACAQNWTIPPFQGKRGAHELLLRSMGLSKVFKLDCPQDPKATVLDDWVYRANDTAIFTSDYIHHLQSLIDYPNSTTNDYCPQRIVVHIRRGDVSPCLKPTFGFHRYLPNQHYLRLIDQYNTGNNNSCVIIYSESISFEPFDDFRKRGYEVVLGGSVDNVWQGILSSDVAILSRSSFSFVPAVLSKGAIVYTPFWHDPLPHWHVVDEAILNETLVESLRLNVMCPVKGKGHNPTHA